MRAWLQDPPSLECEESLGSSALGGGWCGSSRAAETGRAPHQGEEEVSSQPPFPHLFTSMGGAPGALKPTPEKGGTAAQREESGGEAGAQSRCGQGRCVGKEAPVAAL